MNEVKIIRPDSKGRVSLGALAKNISGFKLKVDKKGRIILEPMIEIPASERWLYQNKQALKQVHKGLQDAANGNIVKKDFSSFLDDEDF